jgi:DNA-binding MarR family transcriptional regulator
MEINCNTSDFNNTIAPLLGRTAKMLHANIDDVFHEYNVLLTKQQWVVLKIIYENTNEAIIQNDLAFITDRNKASLTRLINCMEKNHLLIRKQAEKDSRKKIIQLTEKGTHLFLKTKPLVLKSIEKAQKNISEEELQFFFRIMNKIQKNLKETN